MFCSYFRDERLTAEVSYRDKFLFELHRETGRTAVRLFAMAGVQNAFVGDIEASEYARIVQAAIAIYDERMGPEPDEDQPPS